MKPYPQQDQYTPVIDWMMQYDKRGNSQFIYFVAILSEYDSFVLSEYQLSKN